MDVKQQQIDAARRELYEFNDTSRTLESCVQDMRLGLENRRSENERLAKSLRDCREDAEGLASESERLKKNVVEANEEIAITKNLVAAQRETIEKQKAEVAVLNRQLEKYELIY